MTLCRAPGCSQPSVRDGRCESHATRCAVPGCGSLAAPRWHSECWPHVKRRRRGIPVDRPVKPRAHKSPLARLEAAAIALGDADTMDDSAYERARERLRKAANYYAEARVPRARGRDVVHVSRTVSTGE